MEFKKAIDKFVDNLKSLNRSPYTITAYSKDLEQLSEYIGDLQIEQVNTQMINEFIEDLEENDYTNKSISRKLNSIKSFFKYLKGENIVLADPSKSVPHPEIKEKTPRVLKESEYRCLRETSKSTVRTNTLIELMLQTGLRIGEISRIKLEHVKLDSTTPQILITQYGSSPMRIVELNEKAIEAIKKYLPHRLEPENDAGYLFNTKNGNNMLIRNIRSAINRTFKKCDIKDATVNDIRNTFIVRQLDKGVSLHKIAQTVGHKRLSSTSSYTDLMQKRKKPGKGNRIVVIE
jgi:site-specific recombinase XerD